MSGLTLLTYPGAYRAWKALIAAQYAGVTIATPAFDFEKDRQTPEFKASNPLGKVPILQTPNGNIFESNAIARYVARLRADSGLFGRTFFEAAQVEQWLDFSNNELEAPAGMWLYPIMGFMDFNQKVNAEAKKDIEAVFHILQNHLATRTFIVGERVTLADVVLVSALVGLFKMVLTPAFLAPFGNVVRWFTTCINQPQFKAVIGEVVFATEEAQAAKKEKAAAAPKAAAAAKPAAAPKPAPAAKPAKDDDEEEDDTPKEKKKVSILKSLPPSTMSLDATKKDFFSKKPYNPEFFNTFWSTFDKEGYSLWAAKYKYDDENKIFFMTGNLIGGWVQRLDEARPWAMGTVYIYSKDEDTSPYNVGSAWIFRGQNVPEEVMESSDACYYEWVKLDSSNADVQKEFVEHFIGERSPFNRELTVTDRRYFK